MNVRGIVKDEVGSPLGGVRVYGTIAENPVFNVTTNEQGDFRYRDQRTQFTGNRIRVRAEHSGYKSQYKEQTLPPGELRLEFELVRELAAPAIEEEPIRPPELPQAEPEPSPPVMVGISGSVRDAESGGPLAGARVIGTMAGTPLFDLSTNNSGRFDCQVERPPHGGGRINVRVEHVGYKSKASDETLSAGELRLDLMIEKEAPLRLSVAGSVRAGDNREPVAGATVTASVGGRELFRCESERSGTFHFTDLEPSLAGQTLMLRVEAAGFRPRDEQVRLGASEIAVDIGLERQVVPPAAPIGPPPQAPHRRLKPLLIAGTAAGSVVILAVVGWLLQSGRSSQVRVPPVANNTVSVAINKLNQAGLAPTPAAAANPLLANAKVLGTKPAANASVNQGASVSIFIALPDLSNRPLSNAVEELGELGLVPDEPPNAVGTAKVTGTQPPEGRAVPVGQSYHVKLQVSALPALPLAPSPPSQIRVPNVEHETVPPHPAPGSPVVSFATATCHPNGPGQYSLDLSGEATAPTGETLLFFGSIQTEAVGQRFRPNCSRWTAAKASDGTLWEVSCVHHTGDAPVTQWRASETIRIVTAPTAAYAVIVDPATHKTGEWRKPLDCK